MATTAQCIALGNDSDFRARFRALMLLEAGAVYGESGATPNHSARALFASKIVNSPSLADSLASAIAQRTNLTASTVTVAIDAVGRVLVQTDASDASIRSQINTDWNLLASV